MTTHTPYCQDHDDTTDACSTDAAAVADTLLWGTAYPSGTELYLMQTDPARPYTPTEWRALIRSMTAVLATVDPTD